MGAYVSPNGKWDPKNAPTNRVLMRHNEVLYAIVDAFKWLGRREREQKRKRKRIENIGQPISQRPVTSSSKNKTRGSGDKPTLKISPQETVARHNIVNSITDHIPPSKLTEQTRHLFKGKTFEYMASNYPFILITFLKERKELCFPKEVFEQLIKIAKSQIDSRSMK